MSDDGDDTDGNVEDDPTFFAVGLDNDQMVFLTFSILTMTMTEF